MQWQRPAQEIAGLFSFLGSDGEPSVRSSGGYLEDESVTLLRGRLTSKNVELDVTLEATRPASRPDELHLMLWVLPVYEAIPGTQDVTLLATVRWGEYEVQLEIAGEGRYRLPARKIGNVVGDIESAAADLNITLQEKR